MPAYTFFNRSKKALCAIQVIDDTIEKANNQPVTLAEDELDLSNVIPADSKKK